VVEATVNAGELGFTLLLVAGLLVLAGYFGRRQLQTLRGLTAPETLGQGDRLFLRKQAYRRLICSALMVVLAALLVTWLFLEPRFQQVQQELTAAHAVDPNAEPTDEQRAFTRLFGVCVIVALLVLMVLLAVAGMDFWATARYGLSQQRQLQADQRAVLKEHADRYRRERNGFK
jgi:hypothetical protein